MRLQPEHSWTVLVQSSQQTWWAVDTGVALLERASITHPTLSSILDEWAKGTMHELLLSTTMGHASHLHA